MFAPHCLLLEKNKTILSILARPFWIMMAVFCIVFSSASKKLIEQRLAPFFTVSQSAGKKIKDGCRDKRDSFRLYVQSEKKSADTSIPEILFLLPALVYLAGLRFYRSDYSFCISKTLAAAHCSSLPLYLSDRNLRI